MNSPLDKLNLDGIPGLTPEIIKGVIEQVSQSGNPKKAIEKLLASAGPVARSRGESGTLKNPKSFVGGTISVADVDFPDLMYMRLLLTGAVSSHVLGLFYQAYNDDKVDLGVDWANTIDKGREVLLTVATGKNPPNAIRVAIAGASADGLPSASPMIRHLYVEADTVKIVTRTAIEDFGRVRCVAHLPNEQRLARVFNAWGFTKIEKRDGYTIRVFEDK